MLKGNAIPLKQILTERVLIRPVKARDAAVMCAAMKDSYMQLKAWMPWAQSLASLRDTELYLAHSEKLWLAPAKDGVEYPLQIMDRKNKIYYGATGIKLCNLQIPSFEIGYWVNKKYAGQGLITEAMNALTRYLFEALHAKRVEINCEDGNIKSAKIAERLHYDFEGKIRNSRFDATGSLVSHSLVYSCIDVSKLPPLSFSYE